MCCYILKLYYGLLKLYCETMFLHTDIWYVGEGMSWLVMSHRELLMCSVPKSREDSTARTLSTQISKERTVTSLSRAFILDYPAKLYTVLTI
jgi:hypothetical protein